MDNEEILKNPKKKSLMSFYKFSTITFTKHSLINPKSKPEIPTQRSTVEDEIKSKPSLSLDKIERRPNIRSNERQNHVMGNKFKSETHGKRWLEEDSFERKKGGGGVVAKEGRRSVSHVEKDTVARVIAAAEMLTVKILAVDMPGFMQGHAFRCARMSLDSLEKFSSKHLAFNLKKEFDKRYGPAWHCIVGSSFGSFVTHSTGRFIYFSMDKLFILLFQTEVRPAFPH